MLQVAMSIVGARRSSPSRRHTLRSYAAFTPEWNGAHRSPRSMSPKLSIATRSPSLHINLALCSPPWRSPITAPFPCKTQRPSLFPSKTQALPPLRFSTVAASIPFDCRHNNIEREKVPETHRKSIEKETLSGTIIIIIF
ncbi:hypothetical protein TIFTF001_010109 [Ficus carica]|uniref:Uncharacterized protein n=1 Tax=Ficus carica TaxID=3494 RepID=A0AA88CZI7_FICCA|nr:hypothetical protein TIFTF001_010109 [Ficus carica]